MAHALARRRGNTGYVANNRLCHIGLNVGCRLFFGVTADLSYHDNGFGGGILLKQGQHIYEMTTGNRVAANAHA